MYKTSMKRMALLLLSILVVSLTACGTQTKDTAETSGPDSAAVTSTETSAVAETPAEDVTLKCYVHYTSDDEKKGFDYAMAELKKIMPNVSVEIDPQTQDSGAKFKTMMATGNLPDFFDSGTTDIPGLVKSNSIIPLEDYVNKLNLLDQLCATGLEVLKQQDGHIWSMPAANTNFGFIYVNKTLFDQAGAKVPENFDELLAAGKLLKEKGITPLGIWLKENWPVMQLYDMVALTENPKGMADLDLRGAAKASDPAFLHAAQKIQQIANAGLISKDAFTMDYNAAVAEFENGKSAMMMCGNWMAKEFGEKLGENNVEILLPSAFADASAAQAVKDSGVISGGGFTGGYSVASYSKHKDIAAEYAVQAALKMAEARIIQTGELNTVFKNPPSPETPYNAVQTQLADAVSKANSSSMMGWAFESNKIGTDLGAEVTKLYTGKYKPEDFAKNADKMLAADRAADSTAQ
jgi:raffinose/stachyose/melibiose transport system substrate-binding protein